MPPQFIYTMYGLKKIAPGTQREILKGITLAFYPTAKIGVLGPNGAGKSTLLRIMAGIDKEYVGDARITDGYRAGLLAQEPQLDASKDVRGNVEEGVADRRAVLKRYEELSAKFGESLSDADMDKLNVDFQKAQDEIEAKGLWDLDSQIDHAMDALRLPPAEQDVTTLSGGERRRGRSLSPASRAPGPTAARRAYEPPRRRVGRVAGAHAHQLRRVRRRGHA
jgi:ATPase subunit of ABC transporter with duplicated ATPase domains